MASNVIDSKLFRDQFGTEEMREIFADESLLQKWLDTEAALAQAEAKHEIIPIEAADIISKNAHISNMDFDEIRLGMKNTSHPLITVIRSLEQACGTYAGGYVHWGATTQDIIDTGLVLQMKQAYLLLLDQLHELLDICLQLSNKYKSAVMPGRTHGQHALPITFGYKVAVWVDEIGRHIERLKESEKRYLTGQFAGAAGTLASLKTNGLSVQKTLIESLGLYVSNIPWHVSRDGFAEFASILGMVSGTVGKIANEIINLQRTEIGEVEEGFEDGKVGSSTMPHKRNPMVCEYIVSLSQLVRRKSTLGLDCMVQEHERDMTFWQTEWSYLPEICIHTSGMLDQLSNVLTHLTVYEDKMRENLAKTQGLIVSENVMLTLGQKMGRQSAHDVVYEASMKAFDNHSTLKSELLNDERVTQHLSKEQITEAVNPLNYIGHCTTFVKQVSDHWQFTQTY